MLFKLTLLVASSVVLLSGVAHAVDLVELNDANRALLSLDMAKSLDIVQKGFSKGFSFDSVAEARKFVEECKDLSASISTASDDDFQGLAGKIKAVLAEPTINQVCDTKLSKFDQFATLDEKVSERAYLSSTRLAAILALDENLERHPRLKTLLVHLAEKTKRHMAEELLRNAAEDTKIFFGDLKPDGLVYNAECDIAIVKPVCQFARRSSQPKIKAIGADFADLKALIESDDQAKLSSFAEASGVSLDDLTSACQSMQRDLHAMRQVNKFMDANLISKQQITDLCKNDPKFSFYYNLSELCLARE